MDIIWIGMQHFFVEIFEFDNKMVLSYFSENKREHENENENACNSTSQSVIYLEIESL